MTEAEKKTATDRVNPATYNQLLRTFDLDNIVLSECSIKCDWIVPPRELNGSFKVTPMDFKLENGFATFNVSLEFTVASADEPNKLNATIRAHHKLRFKCGEGIDNDFLEIFSNASLPIIVWPFCRELVYNLTHRMGLPPFTAPLIVTPQTDSDRQSETSK